MASLYRDFDALNYNPRKLGEERGAINHIKKVKQKAKGLEIVFDPKGHRQGDGERTPLTHDDFQPWIVEDLAAQKHSTRVGPHVRRDFVTGFRKRKQQRRKDAYE
jgi:hypothetical protein